LINQKSRTIGRSFRIEERWLNIVNEEAEREGISPNALMNRVLQDYCMFGRNLKRFPAITLSQKVFSKIIASCQEEKLRIIARESGVKSFRDVFKTLGLDLSLENIFYFIKELLSRYANWFTYSYHIKKKMRVFHLRHYCGENWSVYLSELITAVIDNCLNIKPKVEFSEETVTIYVPVNQLGVDPRAKGLN
jgi:predicted helicase